MGRCLTRNPIRFEITLVHRGLSFARFAITRFFLPVTVLSLLYVVFRRVFYNHAIFFYTFHWYLHNFLPESCLSLFSNSGMAQMLKDTVVE